MSRDAVYEVGKKMNYSLNLGQNRRKSKFERRETGSGKKIPGTVIWGTVIWRTQKREFKSATTLSA